VGGGAAHAVPGAVRSGQLVLAGVDVPGRRRPRAFHQRHVPRYRAPSREVRRVLIPPSAERLQRRSHDQRWSVLATSPVPLRLSVLARDKRRLPTELPLIVSRVHASNGGPLSTVSTL